MALQKLTIAEKLYWSLQEYKKQLALIEQEIVALMPRRKKVKTDGWMQRGKNGEWFNWRTKEKAPPGPRPNGSKRLKRGNGESEKGEQ